MTTALTGPTHLQRESGKFTWLLSSPALAGGLNRPREQAHSCMALASALVGVTRGPHIFKGPSYSLPWEGTHSPVWRGAPLSHLWSNLIALVYKTGTQVYKSTTWWIFWAKICPKLICIAGLKGKALPELISFLLWILSYIANTWAYSFHTK